MIIRGLIRFAVAAPEENWCDVRDRFLFSNIRVYIYFNKNQFSFINYSNKTYRKCPIYRYTSPQPLPHILQMQIQINLLNDNDRAEHRTTARRVTKYAAQILFNDIPHQNVAERVAQGGRKEGECHAVRCNQIRKKQHWKCAALYVFIWCASNAYGKWQQNPVISPIILLIWICFLYIRWRARAFYTTPIARCHFSYQTSYCFSAISVKPFGDTPKRRGDPFAEPRGSSCVCAYGVRYRNRIRVHDGASSKTACCTCRILKYIVHH